MKSRRAIFETKMFIYHSKTNLDEEILFGKIIHLKSSKIREIPLRGFIGVEYSMLHSGL